MGWLFWMMRSVCKSDPEFIMYIWKSSMPPNLVQALNTYSDFKQHHKKPACCLNLRFHKLHQLCSLQFYTI